MTPNAFDPQQTAPEGTPQRHADASPQTIEALQASEARYRAQAVAHRAVAGVGPGNVEIEEEVDGEDPASGR
jgi:hypothetical protein